MSIMNTINEDIISVAEYLKMLGDMAGNPIDWNISIKDGEKTEQCVLMLRKVEDIKDE